MDLATKSNQQLHNIIENHRKQDKLKAPLSVAAIEEPTGRSEAFDFKAGLNFLTEAARDRRSVTYRQLAKAGGIVKPGARWSQNMTREIPLYQIVDWAHTHDLPILTSLVETQQGITDSILAGFGKALEDIGIRIPDGLTIREFYLSERERTFNWANSE